LHCRLNDTMISFFIYIIFQSSDKLGLSLELGSFAAGVMISTTDLAQHTLEQVSVYTRTSKLKLVCYFVNGSCEGVCICIL
jgi:predicted Kef-type K+ transport protein